ncbi:MAG: hypothetical protein HYX24_00765, partial [Candidatus Aenigmarchaeota archaeon]|nr:hypothetical protein [Candidatus Aenigmarchaeota archaeon]
FIPTQVNKTYDISDCAAGLAAIKLFANLSSTSSSSPELYIWNVTWTENTCSYSSGNWSVACSDYCNITSSVSLNSNSLIFSGSGRFLVNANITGFSRVVISDGCMIAISDGNRLEGGG